MAPRANNDIFETKAVSQHKDARRETRRKMREKKHQNIKTGKSKKRCTTTTLSPSDRPTEPPCTMSVRVRTGRSEVDNHNKL